MTKQKKADPRGDGAVRDDAGQSNIIDYSNDEPLLLGMGDNSSHEYPGKIVVNNEPERVLAVNDFQKYGTTNQSGKDAVGADTTEPTLPTGAPQGLYEIDHNAHGLNFNNKIVWNDLKEDDEEFELMESHGPIGSPEEELEIGIKVEMEHTKDPKIAEQIAKDHIKEHANYYTKGLIPMEKKLSEMVSVPGSAVEKNIGTDCTECQRKSNEEEMISVDQYPLEMMEAFVPSEHPRAGPGSSKGGQFVSKDGGGDEGDGTEYSRQQLKYKTIIQGKEVSVNGNQKKLWEKHTSEDQRNDPNFSTDYGTQLMQQGQDAPTTPEPEPTAAPEPEPEPTAAPEPEPEPIPTTAAAGKEIYDNLPGDTEKAGEGLTQRKAVFADYEERNGRLFKLESDVKYQTNQMNYQKEKLAAGDDTEAMANSRRANIDALEKEVTMKQDEIDKITGELNAAGKLEYEEIQRLLMSRQTYDADLLRRKKGSMAWYKASGQVFAHDREIDKYRTGKKEGHFAGEDMAAHKAKLAEEYEKQVAGQRAARAEKDKVKHAKMNEQNDESYKRLKSKGFDMDEETGKFKTPPDEAKWNIPEPISQSASPAEHKKWLKDYKSAIENQVDIRRLRVNNDTIKQGYSSDYDKRDLKAAKWKMDNFVDDHKMTGVVMYNDGDKSQTAIYEKKFLAAPPVGRKNVKTISIYKGIGAGKVLSANKRRVTMGSWDNKGGVELYFASSKYRKILANRGMTKEDFDLTADHEFGHSTWRGTKDHIDKTGTDTTLAKARDEFSSSVKGAYQDPTFTIHEYTDSYSRGGASMGRGPDILENEAHSKLREFESDGSLDKLESSAKQVVDWNKDIRERPEADERMRTKFGSMNDLARSQGFKDEAHALNYHKVITNYRKLREEMYKIV